MAVVDIAVIGAGERGSMYGRFAMEHPSLARIVAVAEPMPLRRARFARTHGLADDRVFADWREMLAFEGGGRIATAVVIATQDQLHADAAVEFARKGYHILCEKPLATTASDCVRIVEAVERAGVTFAVGHVLRYSPYFRALKAEVESDRLGPVINIQHTEPVGWFHFAHSYVRGSWANVATSAPSLLTKSCHDIDILIHLMHPHRPTHVSSFGSLSHFQPSQKPRAAGGAKRCLDCPIKDTCAYSATRIYLDPARRGQRSWPVSVVAGDDGESPTADIEDIVAQRLRDSRYGLCVFDAGNDVCDNQVVTMRFDNGATAAFTMVAFTERVCQRRTVLACANGEITGDMKGFETFDFSIAGTRDAKPDDLRRARSFVDPGAGLGGHGGGDFGLARTFVEAVQRGDRGQEWLGCTVRDVCESHLVVFAAEEARKTNTVMDISKFINDAFAKKE